MIDSSKVSFTDDRIIALQAARMLQRSALSVTDPKLRTTLNAWAGTLRQQAKPTNDMQPTRDTLPTLQEKILHETRYF
jgi:hypothetical protein